MLLWKRERKTNSTQHQQKHWQGFKAFDNDIRKQMRGLIRDLITWIQPLYHQSGYLLGLPPASLLLVLFFSHPCLHLLFLHPVLTLQALCAASDPHLFLLHHHLLLQFSWSAHRALPAPSPSPQPGTQPACWSGRLAFLLQPARLWFSAGSSSGPASLWRGHPCGLMTSPSASAGRPCSSSPAAGSALYSSAAVRPGGHKRWTSSPARLLLGRRRFSWAAWRVGDSRKGRNWEEWVDEKNG